MLKKLIVKERFCPKGHAGPRVEDSSGVFAERLQRCCFVPIGALVIPLEEKAYVWLLDAAIYAVGSKVEGDLLNGFTFCFWSRPVTGVGY